METVGSDAIVEWVDGLEEPDLNAALRCLAINEKGSVAERRYRLVRFQLRRQHNSNLSWAASDSAPIPGTAAADDLVFSQFYQGGRAVLRTRGNLPDQPISTQVSLSSSTQVTFSGERNATVPTTTTSATVSTISAARYTTGNSNRPVVIELPYVWGIFQYCDLIPLRPERRRWPDMCHLIRNPSRS